MRHIFLFQKVNCCGILYFIKLCLLNDFAKGRDQSWQNRVTIQIAGQHYTMLANGQLEYMNEVRGTGAADHRGVRRLGRSRPHARVALATVNLADEYIKAKTAAEAAEASAARWKRKHRAAATR